MERERDPRTFKYVDDNLQVFRINMETAVRDQGPPPYRDKHAVECQNQFRRIIRRAEERGMRVNEDKTAMVCTSGAQSYEARAHIYAADGTRIESGNTMKVLGYHLGHRATAHYHVAALSKRMRSKFWVLYHLKKAGFSEDELARVYRTCLLPVQLGSLSLDID